MNESPTRALDRLLKQVARPVEFGPIVSDEFRHGYTAGRLDIVPLIDVTVTALLASQRRQRPSRAVGRPRVRRDRR